MLHVSAGEGIRKVRLGLIHSLISLMLHADTYAGRINGATDIACRMFAFLLEWIQVPLSIGSNIHILTHLLLVLVRYWTGPITSSLEGLAMSLRWSHLLRPLLHGSSTLEKTLLELIHSLDAGAGSGGKSLAHRGLVNVRHCFFLCSGVLLHLFKDSVTLLFKLFDLSIFFLNLLFSNFFISFQLSPNIFKIPLKSIDFLPFTILELLHLLSKLKGLLITDPLLDLESLRALVFDFFELCFKFI